MYDGRIVGPQDEDLLLLDASKTASFNGDAVDLGENFSPAPAHPLTVQGAITVLDQTTGNETYALKVQESDTGVGSWVETGLAWSPEAVGTVYKVFGCTKRFVRLVGTLGGTTPILTAELYVNRA